MTARNSPPKLCHHKKSGRAYVTIDGVQRYQGRWGAPEAQQSYDRLIAQWLSSGRTLTPADGGKPASDFSVAELCLGFWEHAQKHYRKPDGKLTGEIPPLKSALKMLRKTFGNTVACEFGPLALKAVRQKMIDAGWTRKNINRQAARIRQVFRWGVANEVVPAMTITALEAVGPLLSGRSDAKETEDVMPADLAHVNAVKPFVSRQIWAMIQLQLLTGMRPGEVTVMRWSNITVEKDENKKECWWYTPSDHKTMHKGKVRTIILDSEAQNIIRPFMKHSTDAYFFSPKEAEQERNAAKRAANQKKRTPAQRARKSKSRPAPKGTKGTCYPVNSYRNAITRACDKADVAAKKEIIKAGDNPPTVCVAHWHPHQLRHNAGTRIRDQFGIEVAAAKLGHSKPDMTANYTKDSKALQRRTV